MRVYSKWDAVCKAKTKFLDTYEDHPRATKRAKEICNVLRQMDKPSHAEAILHILRQQRFEPTWTLPKCHRCNATPEEVIVFDDVFYGEQVDIQVCAACLIHALQMLEGDAPATEDHDGQGGAA